MSEQSERATYRTDVQCESCLEWFTAEFDNPDEEFSTTCPNCDAYFSGVYV